MSVPLNQANLLPSISVDQSVYEGNTTQQCPLGTRIRLAERVYHYAQASASLGAGTVVCSLAPTASHQSGILAIAATSAGAKVLSGTSSAAVTANIYAEGYFGEATGAGTGELYRIAKNGAGSTGFSITLYDGLATTITSGTGYWLLANPYKNVNVGSQQLDNPVGVVPVNVTSGAYFWLQTWGVANPLHAAASGAGAGLRLGTTGGVAAAFDATTNGGIAATVTLIGKNINLAATAGQNNPVFLTITP